MSAERPDTLDVLAHVRGESDPRRARGFDCLEGCARAARELEIVRRFEETEEGPFVLGVIRTFHLAESPDPTKNPVRAVVATSKAAARCARELAGLADLYAWLCELDGEPCLSAGVLAARFAEGEEQEARFKAAEAYASAVLKFDEWVSRFEF